MIEAPSAVLDDLFAHTKSHGFLQCVLEQWPCMLWTTNSSLEYTTSTGAGLSLVGLLPGEIIGRQIFEYHRESEPTSASFIDAHYRALQGESVECEVVFRKKPFHCFIQPLQSTGTISGCVGLGLHTSDEAIVGNSMKRVYHASHDVNNLFTIISGYSELAMRSLESDHPSLPFLREVVVAVERAVKLTRELLDLSRPSK